MSEKFYITTAIAYTSRKPHIGNTYEIVLTDALARFKRMTGNDVFFLTGTDEHGQKIQQLAEEAGINPKEYVDNIAGEVKGIWDLMNTSYDKFIRTTDDYHEDAVQKIFQKLYDQGDIYKGEYEGWYCVPCESFFTDTQIAEGNVCPDCGRPVEKAKEEAYFFKMSKYQDRLMKYIEENPDFIQPESRKKEMVNNFLKPGLQDLCVSRTSFTWGVPVKTDPKHVIYVWIDALSNYITALGYSPDNKGELYNKYWPADAHIIGKDILRFHTIYWPIMLMALGEPLPKQIFGHPWLLNGADKMSKSRGNVMYADDLVRHFGVDAIRYYVLHEMPFAADGTITYETIISRYNSELANTLGNLVNRTIAMTNKYFDGVVTNPNAVGEFDDELIATCKESKEKYFELMNKFRIADAMDEIWAIVRRSNKYIDETMPWALAKDEAQKDRLATVLYNLLESIRYVAVMLQPMMPQTAELIFASLNTSLNTWESIADFGGLLTGEKVGEAKPMFARIDEEKKLAEIEAEIEANTEKEPEIEPIKPEIEFADFEKLDLRVAKVLAAEKVEKADKLLKLTVKLGKEERTVVSGIAKYYKPEDLVGKNVVMVANLKPAKLRGIMSNGMILAVADDDKLNVIEVDGEYATGTQVS
ncbi:MAG: methionine--tRNA ligase [Clostridia bacterium]|nr:methionine--tRNA ligase [Clostridia bacterium]